MINDGYIQAKVQYLNRTTGQLSPESLIEFGSLPENNGPNIFFGIIAGAACPLGSTLVNGSCISNTYLASPSKGGGKKGLSLNQGLTFQMVSTNFFLEFSFCILLSF